MTTKQKAAAAALIVSAIIATPVLASDGRPTEVVELKDARIKFEINATDGDGGVQVFIDADTWRTMSIFDPTGRLVFTATARGRLAKQGGTELFMETGEPTFVELPLDQLLARWPEGEYRFEGIGLQNERLEGSAVLSHDLPDGPRLISPLSGDGAQDPDSTTVRWERVEAPNQSPIIGYQVLVVRPDTGMTALPKITLDVMMPPDASELAIPPGFLRPGTEYEWEVLAIESGGNQTLSSGFFTTAGAEDDQGNDDTDSSADAAEGADVPIPTPDLQRASRVALEAVGGGVVTGSEIADEESFYEIEVTLEDGTQVDVQLDEAFRVVDIN